MYTCRTTVILQCLKMLKYERQGKSTIHVLYTQLNIFFGIYFYKSYFKISVHYNLLQIH